MKKFFITLCTAFALTLGVFSPVIAADIPDEQLTTPRPPVENTGGYSGAYYDDQRTLYRAFTYVEASEEKRNAYQETIKDISPRSLVYIDESGIELKICKDRGLG